MGVMQNALLGQKSFKEGFALSRRGSIFTRFSVMTTKNLKNQVGRRVSRFKSGFQYGLENSQCTDGHTNTVDDTGKHKDSSPRHRFKETSDIPKTNVKDAGNNDNSMNTSGLGLDQDLAFRNITPGTSPDLKSKSKN
jgi:hypothetical protein